VTRSHAHSGDALTMTVLRNMGAWDGSNCRVVGDRVAAYAKNPPPAGAEWIDYGFSVYSAEVLAAHDEGTLEGLVGELAAQGEVRAWPVGERFYEIGSKEALAETEGYLASSGVTGRRPEARLL